MALGGEEDVRFALGLLLLLLARKMVTIFQCWCFFSETTLAIGGSAQASKGCLEG